MSCPAIVVPLIVAWKAYDNLVEHPELFDQRYYGPEPGREGYCFAGHVGRAAGFEPIAKVGDREAVYTATLDVPQALRQAAQRALCTCKPCMEDPDPYVSTENLAWALLGAENHVWRLFDANRTAPELCLMITEQFGPRPETVAV